MKLNISETTVRVTCIIVIACWLLSLMSFVLMVVAGQLIQAQSILEPIGIIIFAPASLAVLFSSLIMVGAHMSILTVTASVVCIAIAIPKVKYKEWAPWTFYLAAVALLGHCSFLLLPHPPKEHWLRTIGLLL